jgi:uncharacterized membrane protein
MLGRHAFREKALTGLLQTLVTLAYPLVILLALRVASPRAIGLAVLALLALRLIFGGRGGLASFTRLGLPIAAGFAASTLASLWWNDALALLLTPVLVNLALFAAFAASFFQRETLIETLALEQAGSLSSDERAYCRKVTALWCAFLLANAAVSAKLALDDDRALWALYVGVIAYVLMGLLFAAEFVYRHWRFRRYVGLPTDPLFRRLFPPDADR